MKAYILVFFFCVGAARAQAEVIETDICVFGGTSAGIISAIQAKKMGKTVVIAEPGKFLGGLTTGGLSATDIGNKAAVGGLSRDFYHRIAKHYTKDGSWTIEKRGDYFTRRGSGQSAASNLDAADATMWTFEPKVARAVYDEMLRENSIRVLSEQRLKSAKKSGARITEFTTEDGTVFRAKMFIDCTYEGDLMAKAGVSYHVGREANATYGETLNGVCKQTPKHQFTVAVDPYVKRGDASSGLLPFIQPGDGGKPGDGDKSVQAYNYRLCFTTNEANRGAVIPPPNYDAGKFELLGRYLEALVAAGRNPQLKEFWNPIWMPNQKTDINNNGGFSTDFIGANYGYPEADYVTRERMCKEHENYIRGFLTFLANSPRVPENMRREMQQWGPCRDEFPETGGWPNQLYVREARRMISDYVMTEKNCRYQEVISDSVGLAAYNMDSHNCQRLVMNGRAENEGDVQVAPMKPYPISYRSLVPKQSQCENLFVPVCMAASHIAYGSIRMEPVFMILGQSSATAAAMAIDEKIPVQKVDYAKLRARLLADKQVLDWAGAGRVEVAPMKLEGIVIDDANATKVGEWVSSSVASPRVGSSYIHDNNAHKGEMSATLAATAPRASAYEVVLIFTPHSNRASNVPVTVRVGDRVVTSKVNQQRGNGLASLGKFELAAGKSVTITVSNQNTDGFVVVDGLQLLPAK
ncbi:MAG TPA: FAD-dependent oxidoreductase [Candidatus Limnocylindria bacterium]|nr:FAD-dependent oxidoreductase [Candidatus Limnocylindria bacterium]